MPRGTRPRSFMRSRTASSSAWICGCDSAVAITKQSTDAVRGDRSSARTSLARLSSSASTIHCSSGRWSGTAASGVVGESFKGSGLLRGEGGVAAGLGDRDDGEGVTRLRGAHGRDRERVAAEDELHVDGDAGVRGQRLDLLLPRAQQAGVVVGVRPALGGGQDARAARIVAALAQQDALFRRAQRDQPLAVPGAQLLATAPVADQERALGRLAERPCGTAEGGGQERLDLGGVRDKAESAVALDLDG